MAQVWTPQESKIRKIQQDNPTYWALLVSRSQYNEAEICQALDSVDSVNGQLAKVLEVAYDLIEGMDPIKGYDSKEHQSLGKMISSADYVAITFSQNSHKNALPVKKWQNEVAKLERKINKIEKMIGKF